MNLELRANLRLWDSLFGWKRRREAAATLKHVEWALAPGSVVVDIGCGMGYALEVLSEKYEITAIGCDVVPTTNRHVSRFCRFDGWRLPFRDKSVDFAMMIFVLHHAEDPAMLLHEAARIARRGVLVVEDTPSNAFDARWGEIHIRRFNKRHGIPWIGDVRSEGEWRRLFERCELKVEAAARLGRLERLPPVARTAFLLDPRRVIQQERAVS